MPTKKNTAKKEESTLSNKVAVFSSGKLSHPKYGRLEKGYNIITKEDSEAWMKISNKVREATPEEVAVAYGV